MADDFLDQLDAVEHKAEIVPKRRSTPLTAREKKVEKIRQLEEELYQEAMFTLRAVSRFKDVDPDSPGTVPAHWYQDMDEEEAQQTLRVAQYGLMSAKEAPVALKLAAQFATGMMSARSKEKAGPRSLNVTFVKMIDTNVNIDSMEVDD